MTSPTMSAAARLEVSGLSTSFATDAGRIQSVADVSFAIHPGETLALVGESGSGKSVTSLTLMGLHARTSQAQVTGQAWFVQRDGRKVDVLAMPEAEKRTLRRNRDSPPASRSTLSWKWCPGIPSWCSRVGISAQAKALALSLTDIAILSQHGYFIGQFGKLGKRGFHRMCCGRPSSQPLGTPDV